MAQEGYDPSIFSKNKIKARYGYSISLESVKDTSLITEEQYNAAGYITLHKNYRANGSTSEYIYEYHDDSLRTKRITKFNGNLHSTTKLLYDEHNRIIRTETYDSLNQLTGDYEQVEYKKKGRKVIRQYYLNHKLVRHTVESFDKKKRLDSYKEKRNGKWVDIPVGDVSKFIAIKFQNYNDTGLNMVRTSKIYDSTAKTIGAVGFIDIKKGDVIFTESYYDDNDLILFVGQAHNLDLVGKKIYKYTSSIEKGQPPRD